MHSWIQSRTLVGDMVEEEAGGGSCDAAILASFLCEKVVDDGEGEFLAADVDDGTNEIAHHFVEEVVSLDAQVDVVG